MGSVHSLKKRETIAKYFEYKKINFARFYNSTVLRIFTKSRSTSVMVVFSFLHISVSTATIIYAKQD